MVLWGWLEEKLWDATPMNAIKVGRGKLMTKLLSLNGFDLRFGVGFLYASGVRCPRKE